jgi:hypothetical protein
MWASHQLRVGIPIIIINQTGSIEVGASTLCYQGEQLLGLVYHNSDKNCTIISFISHQPIINPGPGIDRL